jgi:large subunit ribosomal protein LX
MSEIKIFRITGTYFLKHKKYKFSKEIRALKQEEAVEKALSQVTSIGIYRRQINIAEIKEISPDEAEDYLVRELSS